MTATPNTTAITGDTITTEQMDRLAVSIGRVTPKMDPTIAARRLKEGKAIISTALGKGMEIRPVGEIREDGRIRVGRHKWARPRFVPGPELAEKRAKRRAERPARLAAKKYGCKALPVDATPEQRQKAHDDRQKRKGILRAAVSEKMAQEAAERREKGLPFPVMKRKTPSVPFGAHDPRSHARALAMAQMMARMAGKDEPEIDATTLALIANAGKTEGAVV